VLPLGKLMLYQLSYVRVAAILPPDCSTASDR
jgi:hypothetical protein